MDGIKASCGANRLEVSRRAWERHCGVTCCSKCTGGDLAGLQTEIFRSQCNASPVTHYKMVITGATISPKVVLHWQFAVLMAMVNLGNISKTSAGHIQVSSLPLSYRKKTCIIFHVLGTILFGGKNKRIDRRKKKNLDIDCSHLNSASTWSERNEESHLWRGVLRSCCQTSPQTWKYLEVLEVHFDYWAP